MKWYSGKYDRAFKEVMLKEKNHDILKLLLEKILNIEILEMYILNNERLRANVHVKGQRLDLLLKTNIGKINVEVNSNNNKYVHYRNLAYLCDIYAHEFLVGEEYDGRMKYIQVNLSYGLGKEKEKIAIYKIQNKELINYVDNFMIYDVNMDYYMELWYTKDTKEVEENIIIVMLGLEQKELKSLSKKDWMVSRYMEELNKVNEEPEFREYMSYEEDQKKITRTLINEGKEEGKREATVMMVKNLLKNDVPINIIMDSTKLSEEEIMKIKDQN